MGSAGVAGAVAASAAVVAALAGVVQLGRWRNTGDAPSPWLAAGLFVYSGAGLAVPGVALMVTPPAAPPHSSVALLRPVAVPVVMALFATAVRSSAFTPAGDARRAAALVAAIALLATVGVAGSPALRETLGPSLASGPGRGVAAIGQLGVAAAWLVLALAFIRRARRTGDVGWWVPVMLVALGASRWAQGLGHWGVPSSAAVALAQVFRVVAVMAALTGAMRGLQSLVVTLRDELAAARVELGCERLRLQEVEVEDVTRRHQLRGGLAAIGGTAWLLEHHERALDTGKRSELIEGVTVEVRRMQRLLEGPMTKGER